MSPGPVRARLELHVDATPRDVIVPAHHTLLEVLREELSLPGTKHGCELGECGACTVLLDGEPVLSCLTLALDCAGRDVTTVEGASDPLGRRLQEAFATLGGSQCGYCSPGMVIASLALLRRHPEPTDDAIKAALAGNICRCTGYQDIVAAVRRGAGA